MTEHQQQPDQVVTHSSTAPSATPPVRPRKRESHDQTAQFVVEACRLMHDSHCTDVVAYDVREKSDVTDYILIATGTSDRQMRSLSDDLQKLGGPYDLAPFGSETDGPTTWVVLDFIEAVVHIFEPQARAFYDLEMLWGDCPQVQWERPAAKK